MKRLLLFIFSVVSLHAADPVKAAVQPEIDTYKISNITEVEKSFNRKTMTIFDLDDVLVKWIKRENKIISMAVQGSETLKIFKAAISDSRSVLGLTARPDDQAELTFDELSGVGFRFPDNFVEYPYVLDRRKKPKMYMLSFPKVDKSVSYYRGVIYTSHTDKGQALFEFLRRFELKDLPEEIVFIDDLEGNIKAVYNFFAGDFVPQKLSPAIRGGRDLLTLEEIRTKVKKITLYHYTARLHAA